MKFPDFLWNPMVHCHFHKKPRNMLNYAGVILAGFRLDEVDSMFSFKEDIFKI
jgi:hypothetical protein